MKKTRFQLLGLWLLCALVTFPLIIVMFLQALGGSEQRVMTIFEAFDICGNEGLGGSYGLTVSAQVGNALVKGRRWAVPTSAVIDTLMGRGHCLSKATIQTTN